MKNIGYTIIILILVLPIISQSADSKLGDAQKKLDNAQITYDRVKALLLALTPCSQETIKTIQEYCGPYAFFGYIDKTHEKNKESIVHMHMSPGDAAIATFGKNNVQQYCVRIHSTSGGGDNVVHQCYSKLLGGVWAPDASKIAISYSDGSYEYIPTDTFTQSGPHYGHYPQSITSRYVVTGVDESPTTQKTVPVVTVLHYDGDDAKVLKRIFVRGAQHDCLIPVAFMNKGKYLAIFDKKGQRLYAHNWLEKTSDYLADEPSDYLSDITAADFSCEDPVAGTLYGGVYGGISYDNKNIRIGWTKQVFKDHSRVTLIAACKSAIAAVAGNTIKILPSRNKKVLATFEHKVKDVPSIIKIAPDGGTFAYAAERMLYIMSCAPQKIEEIDHYSFGDTITWMHYGHDGSIYAAYGGTIVNIVP